MRRSQPTSTHLRDAAAGAAVAVTLLLLGAPLGLLWPRLAPRIDVAVGADGRPNLVEYESREFLTVDLTYLALLLAAGAVAGAVSWAVLRRHGPAVPGGLALGGVLAGVVAREVGSRVVTDGRVARFCDAAPQEPFCTLLFDGRGQLGAPQLALGLAVSALLVHLALLLVRDRPRPQVWPVPPPPPPWPDQVSSG